MEESKEARDQRNDREDDRPSQHSTPPYQEFRSGWRTLLGLSNPNARKRKTWHWSRLSENPALSWLKSGNLPSAMAQKAAVALVHTGAAELKCGRAGNYIAPQPELDPI